MTTPAWTGLTIIAKGIPLGAWVRPRAQINGHPIQLNWGVNHIGAHPGVHRVQVDMPWLFPYGRAEITVDNTTAPAPPIHYSLPWTAFTRGAIGLQPQKNPGLLAFILLMTVPLAVILLCLGVVLGLGALRA